MENNDKEKCKICESNNCESYSYHDPISDVVVDVVKCMECGGIHKRTIDSYCNLISDEYHYPEHDYCTIKLPVTIDGIEYKTKYEIIDALTGLHKTELVILE